MPLLSQVPVDNSLPSTVVNGLITTVAGFDVAVLNTTTVHATIQASLTGAVNQSGPDFPAAPAGLPEQLQDRTIPHPSQLRRNG